MPLSFSNYQLLMFMLAVWLDFFAMVGTVPFLVVIFKLMITVIIGQKNRGIKTRIQGSTIHPKNAQEKGQKPTKNLRTPTIITTEICCILHYMAT